MSLPAATLSANAAPRRGRDRSRWLLAPIAAIVMVWLLLLLMRWMIRAPEGAGEHADDLPAVEMVRVQKQENPQEQQSLPAAAPPAAPAAPPSLARAALPSISAPSIAIATPTVDINIANADASLSLGSGVGLGASGAFGGFAGGGGGGGGGNGAGYGSGEGFKGKPLVPLSTARPQMPEWACKQKIKGWVEVVFTVMPNGRVNNVKIVDAQPRGVYESAAIESVSNWIYDSAKQAREVKQRVEMDPADCAYNWH